MSRESRYGHIDNFDNLTRLIQVELENQNMENVNFTVDNLRDYILENWLEDFFFDNGKVYENVKNLTGYIIDKDQYDRIYNNKDDEYINHSMGRGNNGDLKNRFSSSSGELHEYQLVPKDENKKYKKEDLEVLQGGIEYAKVYFETVKKRYEDLKRSG